MIDKNRTEPGATDEEALRDHLAPLRQLQAPADLRAHNRARVREALVSVPAPNSDAALSRQFTATPPLWRRHVSVPFPVAAAFLLTFIGLAALQVAHSKQDISHQGTAVATPPNTTSMSHSKPAQSPATQPAIVKTQNSSPAPASGCTPILQHESVVIAGLGPIQTRNIYICESETP